MAKRGSFGLKRVKKSGLTFKQHQEMSVLLCELSDKVQDVSSVYDAYNKTDEVCSAYARLTKAIRHMKFALEVKVHDEHPEQARKEYRQLYMGLTSRRDADSSKPR